MVSFDASAGPPGLFGVWGRMCGLPCWNAEYGLTDKGLSERVELLGREKMSDATYGFSEAWKGELGSSSGDGREGSRSCVIYVIRFVFSGKLAGVGVESWVVSFDSATVFPGELRWM